MAKIIIRYTGPGCRFPEQILANAEATQVLLAKDDGTTEKLFVGDEFNEGTFAERKLQLKGQIERGIAYVQEQMRELGINIPHE